MNIYAKVKFWSFLLVGIVLIFLGAYLYPFGPDKRAIANLCLLCGCGQLLIFALLYYLRYRRKNKAGSQA